MKNIVFVILLLNAMLVAGQEVTKKIENATGRQIIAGSISEDEARIKAIANAKVDALKKAGVTEHIQSYEMLYKSEIGNNFD